MEAAEEVPVVEPVKEKKGPGQKGSRATVIGLKQVLQIVHVPIPGLTEKVTRSFGFMTFGFGMLIWGLPKNGKSNMIMQLLLSLMPQGKVLYVALEEGYNKSMQLMALRHLDKDEHNGKIEFAKHTMSYDKLREKLRRRNRIRFVVIDSLQYWGITYQQYTALKEEFTKVAFIYVSHAIGKNPDGSVARKIRHDVDVAVHVDRYIAFVQSRFEGNEPYVIWEKGAQRSWGRKYNQVSGLTVKKGPKKAKV